MNRQSEYACHAKRGGPQTPAGKAMSRSNAMTHGLSAKVLLPESFGHRLVECYDQGLREEWLPSTPTEEHFVRELARHRAALERAEQMEEAILRCSAHGAIAMVPIADFHDSAEWLDAALAGAGAAEALEKITRYRRSHELAFLKSFAALRTCKELAAGTAKEVSLGERPQQSATAAERFLDESDCEAYLLSRLQSAVPCPQCGESRGIWIQSRKLWQCQSCRRQRSLREGTVCADSRLSLLTWFRAINALLENSGISSADLKRITGIGRLATVRSMAKRILGATSSSDATVLLAGLDQFYSQLPTRQS